MQFRFLNSYPVERDLSGGAIQRLNNQSQFSVRMTRAAWTRSKGNPNNSGARAHSFAPWVRKFGYFWIQEVVIVIKSSVCQYCLRLMFADVKRLIIRLGISDVKELVKAAHAFWNFGKESFGTNFLGKDPASWMPPCAGYFTRTEDAEIRKKLKTLCQGGKRSSVVKTLLVHGPSGHGKNYSAIQI